MLAHFRLFGLVTAGRDQGSFQFERTALTEHVAFHINLLRKLQQAGYTLKSIRVTITDLSENSVASHVPPEQLDKLTELFPDVQFALDPERTAGRGYYNGPAFHLHATDQNGDSHFLADGGCTTWTQQLLSDKKERLMISGIGSERICAVFGPNATRAPG